MFLYEVPSYPSKIEIDLTIDMSLGETPISKEPYRMSTPKLIELKIQIHE